MSRTTLATEVTLRELKQTFGLQLAMDPAFFWEWREVDTTVTENEKVVLDRVKDNFLYLMEDPPLLENTVKLVVLAPPLGSSGFLSATLSYGNRNQH